MVHPATRRRRGTRRRPGRPRRRDARLRSTGRAGRPRRTRRVRATGARVGEHRRGMVHPTTRGRRGTGRPRRSRRLRRTRRRRRTGRTELRDQLRRYVTARRPTRRTRPRRRNGTRPHPGRARRPGGRRSRRPRTPRAPRRYHGLARRGVRDVPRARRRNSRSRGSTGPGRPRRRSLRIQPRDHSGRRQPAATGHQRRRRLRGDDRRRGPVVVRTRQRRREHRRGQRHTGPAGMRVRVRTRPRSTPGRHTVRSRRLVVLLTNGSRPRGPAPRGTRSSGPRDRGRSGRIGGSGSSRRRLLRTRPPVRNPQLVRRLLKPLGRTQQERRLIQIDALRRLRNIPRPGRDPVLLLVPPYHLAHRQTRPQRRLTTVPGDHQPLTAPVRHRTLGPVLGPHHETQLELTDPDLTVLIRGHITVDPLIRTLLRLRERHHRAHPSTGTARAKPPSTIRFATVSNSGGLPARRWRKASKSSPHGSRSRSTRSCTPQPS